MFWTPAWPAVHVVTQLWAPGSLQRQKKLLGQQQSLFAAGVATDTQKHTDTLHLDKPSETHEWPVRACQHVLSSCQHRQPKKTLCVRQGCLLLVCCTFACAFQVSDMADLKGKVALVTGATSGIGGVTAEYLAGALNNK